MSAPQPERVSKTILHTGRLRLRPRSMDDLDANLAIDLDPEVTRYIFATTPDPERWRARIAGQIQGSWPDIGGVWTVEWRDAPGFLGWCGLFPLVNSGLIEIGYRYARSTWGQGVGTEAARAVLDHGFRTLAIDPIVGVTHPDNQGSQQVLQKIGLRPAGEGYYYGAWLSFFRLSRAAYLART